MTHKKIRSIRKGETKKRVPKAISLKEKLWRKRGLGGAEDWWGEPGRQNEHHQSTEHG